MEFQVQGSVLVDGEWVSRPADVYQIMARNQQQEDVEMDDADTAHLQAVPELAILSKTVVGSPLYSTIIPANIRHKDLDDIVFIGEKSVHLKEICDYGHLRHIATKSDFKGKILAAKAFGDPRKVQINTSERCPLLKRASLHRGRRSTTVEDENTLPLEVIVLTLSTRTLMFLWAKDNRTGPTTFAQKTIQLPTAESRFNRPGQYLAIDPQCRAIAVAAPEGCFMLYKTKTMHVWRRDMRGGHDEVPIVEEAQYSIDGRIMHMDFLSAGTTGDDAHVVLIFVLVHEGKTKIAAYDWDFRHNLDTMPITRSVLDFDNRNPSLLIPLSRSTDFLLVHDEHISVCKGVLSGPPVTTKIPIPVQYLKLLRPGSNKGKPHWVQWDKAPRNPDFAKEAFYLAREDGTVIYVERKDGANPLEISDAGCWRYPIDTAFACLKADSSEFAQSYPDVLVAGGLGSDGYLCKVGAWPKEYAPGVLYSETFEFSSVESLPNWAPLTDMAVTRLHNMPLPYDRSRAGLFISSGKAPYGEISQLRQGLRALVDYSFGGLEGSTGLWLVDHGSTADDQGGSYATFLVNTPLETLILRTSRTQQESLSSRASFGSAWDAGVWATVQPTQDGFIRNAETITACALTEQLAIQITREEARILRRPEMDQVGSIPFPYPLLGAATKPGLPFIVVAFREGTTSVLEIIQISGDGSFSSSSDDARRHSLKGDPTCIDVLVSDSGPLFFVGTTDAGFLLFTVDQRGTLVLVYDTIIRPMGLEGLHHVYESVVLLATHGHEKLVCGTRDGLLIDLDLPDAGLGAFTQQDQLHTPSITRMGPTAVMITPNKIDCSMAFVACGADFCRIHLSEHDYGIHIDSIWLNDPNYATYLQGPVNAIDQVPLTVALGQGKRDLGGFIFAVFGDRMVHARLDYDLRWSNQTVPPLLPEEGKDIPRKLLTTSTPTKLMVAEDLPGHMIVVTNELKEERSPPTGYRTMLSSVKIMDLLSDQPNADLEVKEESTPVTPKSKLDKTEVQLKPYEKVHSMVRWEFWEGKGRPHPLIVIGTGITDSLGKETGRRLTLNITKSGLNVQDKKRFDKPVRCIAAYDNQHIVSIIGNVLQLEQLQRNDGARWKPRGQIELPSTGVHMTVSGNFIYVSTSYDSHLCFQVTKLTEPQNEKTFRFTQVFSDSRQRYSLHHLVYERGMALGNSTRSDTHIVLLADKTTSVTGLLHPTNPSNMSATTTLFEASLPRSVIRIQRGDIRPPWRRLFHANTPSSCPTGILDDDIIGACTDGTIYSFSILDGPALHLLRLLQNLIQAKQKRDPALQFSTIKQRSSHIYDLLQNGTEGSQDINIKARDVDPEVQGRSPGPDAPKLRHVDGDILGRFFEEGGDLRTLVEEKCDEDVWKLFLEKAKAVLGRDREWVGSSDERKLDVERVRKWVLEVLMPLL